MTEKNYLARLESFDSAVKVWEINPGFGNNADNVKKAYQDYIFAKGKTELTEELKIRENDLVARCGGLLNA